MMTTNTERLQHAVAKASERELRKIAKQHDITLRREVGKEIANAADMVLYHVALDVFGED